MSDFLPGEFEKSPPGTDSLIHLGLWQDLVVSMKFQTLFACVLFTSATSTSLPQVVLQIGSPSSAVPPEARTAFERGERLLQQHGEPSAAIVEFQEAVQSYPAYTDAFTEMAAANYSLRNLHQAETELKKAIELSSGKSARPLYLLADLLNGQQRYDAAEAFARQAVKADASLWNGYFELARALVGQGKGAEAEASAVKACDLKADNPPAYLVLANAHLLQQKYYAAVGDYDAYLKLAPDGLLSENVRQNRDRLQKRFKPSPEKAFVDQGPTDLR